MSSSGPIEKGGGSTKLSPLDLKKNPDVKIYLETIISTLQTLKEENKALRQDITTLSKRVEKVIPNTVVDVLDVNKMKQGVTEAGVNQASKTLLGEVKSLQASFQELTHDIKGVASLLRMWRGLSKQDQEILRKIDSNNYEDLLPLQIAGAEKIKACKKVDQDLLDVIQGYTKEGVEVIRLLNKTQFKFIKSSIVNPFEKHEKPYKDKVACLQKIKAKMTKSDTNLSLSGEELEVIYSMNMQTLEKIRKLDQKVVDLLTLDPGFVQAIRKMDVKTLLKLDGTVIKYCSLEKPEVIKSEIVQQEMEGFRVRVKSLYSERRAIHSTYKTEHERLKNRIKEGSEFKVSSVALKSLSRATTCDEEVFKGQFNFYQEETKRCKEHRKFLGEAMKELETAYKNMLYQFSFLYYALDNKCQFPFETTFKAWYYTSGKGETYIKFRRVGVIDDDEDLSSSGMEFSIDDEVG